MKLKICENLVIRLINFQQAKRYNKFFWQGKRALYFLLLFSCLDFLRIYKKIIIQNMIVIQT